MSLTTLSSAQLHRLIELVRQKESIVAELAKVDQALQELEDPATLTEKPSVARRRSRRRRRGALKVSLLKLLDAAGKDGVAVKELATKVGVKPANVHAWFYTTGKKVNGIKKVGKARFAYIP